MRRNSFYLGVVLLVGWAHAQPAMALDSGEFSARKDQVRTGRFTIPDDVVATDPLRTARKDQAKTGAVTIPDEVVPTDPLRTYAAEMAAVLDAEGRPRQAKTLRKAVSRLLPAAGAVEPQLTKTQYAKPAHGIRSIGDWTGRVRTKKGEMELHVTFAGSGETRRMIGGSATFSEPRQPMVVGEITGAPGPVKTPLDGTLTAITLSRPDKFAPTYLGRTLVGQQRVSSNKERRVITNRNFVREAQAGGAGAGNGSATGRWKSQTIRHRFKPASP